MELPAHRTIPTKRDHTPIDLTRIYENDEIMSGCFTTQQLNNFKRRLRRRGFKLSLCRYAYYHPQHWLNKLMFDEKTFRGAGDHWIYEDSFKARTRAAKKALRSMSYDDDPDCESELQSVVI